MAVSTCLSQWSTGVKVTRCTVLTGWGRHHPRQHAACEPLNDTTETTTLRTARPPLHRSRSNRTLHSFDRLLFPQSLMSNQNGSRSVDPWKRVSESLWFSDARMCTNPSTFRICPSQPPTLLSFKPGLTTPPAKGDSPSHRSSKEPCFSFEGQFGNHKTRNRQGRRTSSCRRIGTGTLQTVWSESGFSEAALEEVDSKKVSSARPKFDTFNLKTPRNGTERLARRCQ